jgi:hypothetical protein
MSAQGPEDELKEERGKEIFRALVEAEDYQEMPRPQARRLVARRFGISEAQVQGIARRDGAPRAAAVSPGRSRRRRLRTWTSSRTCS